jgi:hypothetical protein
MSRSGCVDIIILSVFLNINITCQNIIFIAKKNITAATFI